MANIFFSKDFILSLLLVIVLIATSSSHAQQSSEQFIPIGQSPGISDKLSYIGKITKVNKAEGTLVVESNRGTKTFQVKPSTRIWLDRSKTRQTNLVTSFKDFEVGRTVEIKQDSKGEGIADWIKIESS